MSNKSQLNNLSKREILESLLARQQQDMSTVNRLVLAVAAAAGLDAEAVAKMFMDAEATGAFADKFNKALGETYRSREAEAEKDAEQSSDAAAVQGE
jgi:hypothetical protein